MEQWIDGNNQRSNYDGMGSFDVYNEHEEDLELKKDKSGIVCMNPKANKDRY